MDYAVEPVRCNDSDSVCCCHYLPPLWIQRCCSFATYYRQTTNRSQKFNHDRCILLSNPQHSVEYGLPQYPFNLKTTRILYKLVRDLSQLPTWWTFGDSRQTWPVSIVYCSVLGQRTAFFGMPMYHMSSNWCQCQPCESNVPRQRRSKL